MNEIKRLQQLAGIRIINENSEGDYKDKQGKEIIFKIMPSNPNEILTQHDDEDYDEDTFSKKDFWDSDVKKMNKIKQGYHDYGGIIDYELLPNGEWKFTWDSGEISGFKEGSDFIFVDENEIKLGLYRLTPLAKKYISYLPNKYDDITNETGNDIIANNLSYIKAALSSNSDLLDYKDAYEKWGDMLDNNIEEYEELVNDIFDESVELKLITKL